MTSISYAPKTGARTFYRLPHGTRRLLQRLFRHEQFCQSQMMRYTDDEYSYKPFDRYRCIFVHIPKTGGISVSRALFGNLAGGHATIRHYQMVFAPEEFNRYFKFAFVRNPWDRLYSAYRFLKQGGMNTRDAQWASNNLSRYESFKEFVLDWVTPENIYHYDHFVPQTDFIYLPGRSHNPLDFIGRFEQLEKNFDKICARLGIHAQLEHRNRTDSNETSSYRDAYDLTTRARVSEVYRMDIEMLGYVFE